MWSLLFFLSGKEFIMFVARLRFTRNKIIIISLFLTIKLIVE